MTLVQLLAVYEGRYPDEETVVKRFLKLLEHRDAFLRTHLPGHITGSSWIVTHDRKKTLLVHHAKLNRWLQPGGHADGDTDVAAVARKEAEEETGLSKLDLESMEIFDLDIHPIPERKDFPAHDHYDIRFLFTASALDPILVSAESNDVRWIGLDELEAYNREPSLLRLREKLRDSPRMG